MSKPPLPHVTVPPPFCSDAQFEHRAFMIRFGDKMSSRHIRQPRVLVLTDLGLFLCSTDGDVKRFAPLSDITSVRIYAPGRKVKSQVFVFAIKGQHDAAFIQVNHNGNCGLEDRDIATRTAYVVARDGGECVILEQPRGDAWASECNLRRNESYQNPKQLLARSSFPSPRRVPISSPQGPKLVDRTPVNSYDVVPPPIVMPIPGSVPRPDSPPDDPSLALSMKCPMDAEVEVPPEHVSPPKMKTTKVVVACQPFKEGVASVICSGCFRLLAFESGTANVTCIICQAKTNSLKINCTKCKTPMRLWLKDKEAICPNGSCARYFGPQAVFKLFVNLPVLEDEVEEASPPPPPDETEFVTWEDPQVENETTFETWHREPTPPPPPPPLPILFDNVDTQTEIADPSVLCQIDVVPQENDTRQAVHQHTFHFRAPLWFVKDLKDTAELVGAARDDIPMYIVSATHTDGWRVDVGIPVTIFHRMGKGFALAVPHYISISLCHDVGRMRFIPSGPFWKHPFAHIECVKKGRSDSYWRSFVDQWDTSLDRMDLL